MNGRNLIWIAAAVLLSTADLHAEWRLFFIANSSPRVTTDTLATNVQTIVGLRSHASAFVEDEGFGNLNGRAEAFDQIWGVSAQSTVTVVSYLAVILLHVGPGVGEVELLKSVSISGFVDLENADAAAASLGFARVQHQFDSDTPDDLRVDLARSTGATSRDELGEVQVNAPGSVLSVNISTGVGEGTYRDVAGGPQWRYARKCPVTAFQFDRRAEAYLHVYANETIGSSLGASAECEATILAQNAMFFALLTHAHCPGGDH